MGADTGFHANEAGRLVGEFGFELGPGQLQAQNDGAAPVETDEVEGILADVDAENGDCVFGMARHGGLLAPGHPPTRGYCGEHRRSIPLRDVRHVNLWLARPAEWEGVQVYFAAVVSFSPLGTM